MRYRRVWSGTFTTLAAPERAIHYFKARPTPGLDDVDAGSSSTETLTIDFNSHRNFALCILANRRAVKFKILQDHVDTGCGFESTKDCGDRSIATG